MDANPLTCFTEFAQGSTALVQKVSLDWTSPQHNLVDITQLLPDLGAIATPGINRLEPERSLVIWFQTQTGSMLVKVCMDMDNKPFHLVRNLAFPC